MLMTIRSWWQRSGRPRGGQIAPRPPAAQPDNSYMTSRGATANGAETAADLPHLVESMLAQDRYCLLLRPQVAASLAEADYCRAVAALERSMASIPGGPVDLRFQDTETPVEDPEDVEPLLLDRYPVTNRQFRQFVEAGGYALPALWEPDAAIAIAELVDQTGMPGPRFWRGAHYPSGEDDHPVVGVSWYEAAAYARWTGKRLPGEGEWLKAAAWPVRRADGRLAQRQFPWGDSMDRGRANVWGSGPGRTVSVRQFSAGVSVGGVYQLIGNVWEWTSGDFDASDSDGRPLQLFAPLKTIRGGAYDTYFEQQASCSFRSGESPLAHKHNIGFRCALGVCDVLSRRAPFAAANQGGPR
jgi:iron(II)-dependent oxidoreductase